MDMPRFVPFPSVSRHLGCFCFLGIKNNTAVDTHVQVLFFCGCMFSFFLGVYMPRSNVDESCGKSMFNIFGTARLFQSDRTI